METTRMSKKESRPAWWHDHEGSAIVLLTCLASAKASSPSGSISPDRPLPRSHARPGAAVRPGASCGMSIGTPHLGRLHVFQHVRDYRDSRRPGDGSPGAICVPSLGPTAFLFFFAPRSPAAALRHAIYGHAIGLICGYGSLVVFGLQHAPSAMHGTVDVQRVLAAALSLSLTDAMMIAFNAVHPRQGQRRSSFRSGS